MTMAQDFYPLYWSIALVIWLGAIYLCIKAVRLRRFTDKVIWGGLLATDITLVFVLATGLKLSLDDVLHHPMDTPTIFYRLLNAGALIIVWHGIHSVITVRFKRFYNEKLRWFDWL